MSLEVRVTDPDTGGQKGTKEERFDLIPAYPLWQLATVYGRGASKYDDNNWRKGYKWSLSFAAMCRHIWQFWAGQYYDQDDGLPHLAHAMWHCATLMEFHRMKLGKDDRWKK